MSSNAISTNYWYDHQIPSMFVGYHLVSYNREERQHTSYCLNAEGVWMSHWQVNSTPRQRSCPLTLNTTLLFKILHGGSTVQHDVSEYMCAVHISAVNQVFSRQTQAKANQVIGAPGLSMRWCLNCFLWPINSPWASIEQRYFSSLPAKTDLPPQSAHLWSKRLNSIN